MHQATYEEPELMTKLKLVTDTLAGPLDKLSDHIGKMNRIHAIDNEE